MSPGCCSHDGMGPVRIPGRPGRGLSGPVKVPEPSGRGKLMGPKLSGSVDTGLEGCNIGGGFVKSVTSKTGAGGLEHQKFRASVFQEMCLYSLIERNRMFTMYIITATLFRPFI